ncbi:hypothetical protein HMI54_009676 [Coelomomyces lativittatus]|nr:hypothetical protein HMI54_009676 [Coelomomyces lativittatus]
MDAPTADNSSDASHLKSNTDNNASGNNEVSSSTPISPLYTTSTEYQWSSVSTLIVKTGPTDSTSHESQHSSNNNHNNVEEKEKAGNDNNNTRSTRAISIVIDDSGGTPIPQTSPSTIPLTTIETPITPTLRTSSNHLHIREREYVTKLYNNFLVNKPEQVESITNNTNNNQPKPLSEDIPTPGGPPSLTFFSFYYELLHKEAQMYYQNMGGSSPARGLSATKMSNERIPLDLFYIFFELLLPLCRYYFFSDNCRVSE